MNKTSALPTVLWFWPVTVLWILPPVLLKQLIIVLQKASFLPGGSDIWGACVVVEDTTHSPGCPFLAHGLEA